MSSNKSDGLGLKICANLTIVFIVLKLVGVVHWSWIWVLAPLWIDLLLAAIIWAALKISDKKSAASKTK